MSFLQSAEIMIALAIPMVVGFFARRFHFMNDGFDRGLSRLVIWICLPCMLLASVGARDLPSSASIYMLIVFSAIAYIVVTIVALVLAKLLHEPQKLGIYAFIMAYGNVGFIGYPVLSALVGPSAILLAAIANIPYNILVFSVGMIMVEGLDAVSPQSIARSTLKSLCSPVVISSIVVLILVLCNANDLGLLGQGLGYVGNLTIPAALLLSGSSLAKQQLIDVKEAVYNIRLWISVLMRLIGIPVLVFFLLKPFVSDSVLLSVLVLGQAMPVATNGLLYCLNANKDTNTMIQGTLLTIICSIVTIPFLVSLFQML